MVAPGGDPCSARASIPWPAPVLAMCSSGQAPAPVLAGRAALRSSHATIEEAIGIGQSPVGARLARASGLQRSAGSPTVRVGANHPVDGAGRASGSSRADGNGSEPENPGFFGGSQGEKRSWMTSSTDSQEGIRAVHESTSTGRG